MKSQVRSFGTDENILSLEAQKSIYEQVAQNLAKGHKRHDSPCSVLPTKLQSGDLVLIKNHIASLFDPTYIGDHRSVTVKGNQVDIIPSTGGKTKIIHIRDVK